MDESDNSLQLIGEYFMEGFIYLSFLWDYGPTVQIPCIYICATFPL